MTTKRTPAGPRTKTADASPQPARKRQAKPRSATAQAQAVAETPSSQPARRPSHEDVALAAYTRYLGRQGAPGSDFDDWLAAERELQGDASQASAHE